MALKRPAASTAASALKKAKTATPQKKIGGASKTNAIKAALLHADLPFAVRDLLTAAVTSMLIMKDERHEYQTACVKMIGEALDGICKRKEDAIAAAQATVDGASEERTNREKAKSNAESKQTELQAALDNAKTVLEESARAVHDASDAFKRAQADQKRGDTETDRAQACKASLEKAQATAAGLKEMAADPATLTALMSECAKAKFDESLLSMLPAVLKKGKEDRGTFGGMALTQFEAEFEKHLQELGSQLVDPEGAKAARANAVEEAATALGAANTKKEEAHSAVVAANIAAKESNAAGTEAARAVSTFAKEANRYASALETAKVALTAYQEGAMAAYKELLELAPPAETPPAEAETAPVEASNPQEEPEPTPANEAAPGEATRG